MAVTEKDAVVKKILDGRREFVFEGEDGNETTFFIADPSGEDVRKADWNYAKVFNQALADGFPTQAQMIEILKGRGILSEEYTRKLEKVKIDLAATLYRLEHMGEGLSFEDKEDLALLAAKYRDEFFRLNQTVNGPMGNTCENLADDARSEYITSRVIESRDGSKVWPKYEDYLQEDNNKFILKCRFEVMAWLNGIESDFLQKMPEQAVLREVAGKRLEEALDKARGSVAAEPVAQLEEGPKLVEDLELPPVEEASASKRGRSRRGKAPKGK